MAKSKLNSIQGIVSQPLTDMDISHEEFDTILKEKRKYEKMKENVRNVTEKQKLSKKRTNNYWTFTQSKSFIFLWLCIKWVKSAKKDKKCEVEIIDKGRYFWINRRDLEVESDYNNWAQIFDKCYPEKQKYRYELMPNTKFQPCRRFVRNGLVKKKLSTVEKHQKNS